MVNDFKDDPLHPLEEALQELDSVTQAGLFRRTPVDVQTLLETPSAMKASPRFLKLRLWGSLAAAAALVIGVWGWLFSVELASIRKKSGQGLNGVRVVDSSTDEFLSRCLTGPGGGIVSGCAPLDQDGDGDVDLADTSVRQLAGVRR